MFKLKSIKTQLIIYLACLAIFLSVKDKDIAFLFLTIIAVVSALVIESIILYFRTRTLQITESSIITGLIIGYVLSSDELWLKFVFVSLLAIISKYLIRFQNKHIFNPAAFGIFLALVFLGASTQWRATYLWYVLIPFGVYFALKFKKIEVLLGYVIISLVLFVIQALLFRVPLGGIFGYFSYFYIFIMVIEPKTTPLKPLGKYFFGAGIAVLIFILTEAGVKFDA